MHFIKGNNWSIKGSEFGLSTFNFYVKLLICSDSKCIAKVYDDGVNYETFMFDSIEEAFDFSENIVGRCRTFEEIHEQYNNKQLGLRR